MDGGPFDDPIFSDFGARGTASGVHSIQVMLGLNGNHHGAELMPPGTGHLHKLGESFFFSVCIMRNLMGFCKLTYSYVENRKKNFVDVELTIVVFDLMFYNLKSTKIIRCRLHFLATKKTFALFFLNTQTRITAG